MNVRNWRRYVLFDRYTILAAMRCRHKKRVVMGMDQHIERSEMASGARGVGLTIKIIDKTRRSFSVL